MKEVKHKRCKRCSTMIPVEVWQDHQKTELNQIDMFPDIKPIIISKKRRDKQRAFN